MNLLRIFTACVVGAWLSAGSIGAGDKAASLPPVFQDNFEKGADRWEPSDPAAWRILETDKGHVYSQFQVSKVKTPFRSPFNMSLVKDLELTDVTLQAKAQSTTKEYGHRDMCLFFGYQDPGHFYYVHMATSADDHANQIFIVNGADRKKISTTTTKGTKWTDDWHNVKLVRRAQDGSIEVYFDDMAKPIMTATDKTFAEGRVGIGSFDDTGNWDDVVISGTVKK